MRTGFRKPMTDDPDQPDEPDAPAQTDEPTLRAELSALRAEHRALDIEIDEMQEQTPVDRIAVQRLKKRKLLLKDRIARLEDQIYPDIIA